MTSAMVAMVEDIEDQVVLIQEEMEEVNSLRITLLEVAILVLSTQVQEEIQVEILIILVVAVTLEGFQEVQVLKVLLGVIQDLQEEAMDILYFTHG